MTIVVELIAYSTKDTDRPIFRSRKYTDVQVLEILDEYESNHEKKSVANKYKVQVSTIKGWLKIKHTGSYKKIAPKRKRACDQDDDNNLQGDFESSIIDADMDIEDFDIDSAISCNQNIGKGSIFSKELAGYKPNCSRQ